MAETTTKTEKKEEKHTGKHEHTPAHTHTHAPVEKETQVKKEEPKKVEKEVKRIKKDEAVAWGLSLPISLKHSMFISSFIKGKSIDQAIADLGSVIAFKRAVPFKGEIPHRRGKGMMSGRYPISASKEFIVLLKGLKGNALVNGLDLEKTYIYYSCPSWAARPARRGGVRGKRTTIVIKAKERVK